MAKQVYYSPARNGQPETAGAAQLPEGQCQEVSIVQFQQSRFVLFSCGSFNQATRTYKINVFVLNYKIYKLNRCSHERNKLFCFPEILEVGGNIEIRLEKKMTVSKGFQMFCNKGRRSQINQ